jgi:tetratricopeptide (TPR) repeat protein
MVEKRQAVRTVFRKGVWVLAVIVIGWVLVQLVWTNVVYLKLFAYLRSQEADFACDPLKTPVFQPPAIFGALYRVFPQGSAGQWVLFQADLVRGMLNRDVLADLLSNDREQVHFYAPLLIQKAFSACLARQQWSAAELMVQNSEKAGLVDEVLQDNLAQMYESQKRSTAAIGVYSHLIDLFPQQAPYYLMKSGQQWLVMKEMDQAQAAFAQAIEKGQTYGWKNADDELVTLLALGDLAMQKKLYPEALTFYQQVPIKDNAWRCAIAWQRISNIYLILAQPAQAIESAKKEIACIPDSPTGYVILGNVYDRLGDTNSALRQFERAYAIDPQSFNLEKYKKKLGILP